MATNRNTLIGWFKQYLKPTEAQFTELINSVFLREEDSLEMNQVNGLESALSSLHDTASSLKTVNGKYPTSNGNISLNYDDLYNRPFNSVQEERLAALVYKSYTATVTTDKNFFEKGFDTNISWAVEIVSNDDNIEISEFDNIHITDMDSSKEGIQYLMNTYEFNTVTKLLHVKAAGKPDEDIIKTVSAYIPQWKGYTAATLDFTYSNSNSNLTKFVSSSTNADVVVSSLIPNAKVVFLSTKPNARVYEANDYDITDNAFTISAVNHKLGDSSTATLYKYETINPATEGTYKLR